MRLLISLGLKGSMLVLMALTLGTQVFAAVHQAHASLGKPFVRVAVYAFYAPWQGVQWACWWLRAYPALFLWPGVAFGVALVGMVALWIMAAMGLGCFAHTPKEKEGELASGRALWWAKLLRKDGIVVGKRG
jgi:hypothetical protein